VPADRSSDDYRAALEAEGWATSFRVDYYLYGPVWVARAAKDDRAVEERGATEREAWEMAYREVFKGGGP
jgi:hypothetical protein